jgi:peptidoglycan/xylan/chitin deacetylase (PgdA/CDA1 family)
VTVYARRRLLALAAALLAIAAIAIAAFVLHGRGGAPEPAGGPIGGGGTQGPAQAAVHPELAAAAPRSVAQPLAIHGDGPIFSVRGKYVERVAPTARTGRVALTFDDGPGPFTLPILRELQSLHAHATFFVIGRNVKQSPGIVRELRAAGMVVGNHSWTHPKMTRFRLAVQVAQIRRTQDELQRTIGQRPRFFRPPMWLWNRTTARAVAEQGMVGVLFSIDTRDWSLPGVTAIVRRALTARDGQIIALHDAGGAREQTLQALPLIVKGLRAQGLEPVTLDQLYASPAR